jgi:hypothetical protein
MRNGGKFGLRLNLLVCCFGLLLCLLAALQFLDVPWNGADLARLAAAEATLAWHGPTDGAAAGLRASPQAYDALWHVGAAADGWLSGAWTTASRVLWSGLFGDAQGGLGERAAYPILYRWENLAVLLLWSLATSVLVRRVATPWFGRDHARAAGAIAFVLLLAHPLAWVACSGLSGRGALLAGMLGTAALALFLRARQERRPWGLFAAALLALLAGAAHAQALLLPLYAAGVEYAAARRYRRGFERLRTTATTFVCACLAVGFEPLLRALRPAALGAAGSREAWQALRDAETWIEAPARLAWQLFPANLEGAGAIAALLAGALWLCALQPALLASRHAPRLWGGGVACAGVALLVSALSSGSVHAQPRDFLHASAQLAALPWLVFALALCCTALSGRWRIVSPLLTCVLCATLSLTDLRGLARAGSAAQGLSGALERTRTLYGPDARYLVLDPPRTLEGLACSGADLAALLDPARGSPPRVDGLEVAAFLAWLRTSEFHAQRERETLIVIVRGSALAPDARGWTSHVLPRAPEPGAARAPLTWRGDGRSPDLAVDPTSVGQLRVAPIAGSNPRTAVVSWRAANDGVGIGHADGEIGRDGWWFDLSASLAWRLSGEVRRVWLEGEFARVEKATLGDSAPLELELHATQSGLVIAATALPYDGSARNDLEFEIECLDLDALVLKRYEARPPESTSLDFATDLEPHEIPARAALWLSCGLHSRQPWRVALRYVR